jgi:phenylacetic acid degradation operon negative regulatory protein
VLTASCKQSRLELERWLRRAGELEPDVAARESFLLGGRAIRQIVCDPLLPPPLVDVAERRAFIEKMKAMDREGRRIWKRFFRLQRAAGRGRDALPGTQTREPAMEQTKSVRDVLSREEIHELTRALPVLPAVPEVPALCTRP